MHWFVTDAQLDAFKVRTAASADATVQACAATVAALAARHEAEVARLRDDRREELTRLADPSAPFVDHLREEVAFWRLQFIAERQRAEIAIDQCRATHQAIGPVSLPPREAAGPRGANPFSDPELSAMGDPIGL